MMVKAIVTITIIVDWWLWMNIVCLYVAESAVVLQHGHWRIAA